MERPLASRPETSGSEVLLIGGAPIAIGGRRLVFERALQQCKALFLFKKDWNMERPLASRPETSGSEVLLIGGPPIAIGGRRLVFERALQQCKGLF